MWYISSNATYRHAITFIRCTLADILLHTYKQWASEKERETHTHTENVWTRSEEHGKQPLPFSRQSNFLNNFPFFFRIRSSNSPFCCFENKKEAILTFQIIFFASLQQRRVHIIVVLNEQMQTILHLIATGCRQNAEDESTRNNDDNNHHGSALWITCTCTAWALLEMVPLYRCKRNSARKRINHQETKNYLMKIGFVVILCLLEMSLLQFYC